MISTHRVIFVLCALALCGLSAWGPPAEQERHAGYNQSGNLPRPVIFAEGTISTGDYETHPAFSPGGDTLFFLKCAPDFSTYTICVSYFKNGRWSSPEVASFSGTYQDGDPFVTADGKEVYFVSNRPPHPGDTAKPDLDIWKTVRTDHGWAEPVRLDAPVNSDGDEYYPTIADNGTLYFGSSRAGGKGSCDIYKSLRVQGRYAAVENLGDSINTAENEYEPFIAPDESYMIYMAAHPNPLGNADLYMSYKLNGVWIKGAKLPFPFSSPGVEFSPKVTRDGKYFFFASTRNIHDPMTARHETMKELNGRIQGAGNGLGDIYQVDFSALPLPHPR